MTARNRPSGYMPTLDGWRAISICLVVLHHIRISVPVHILGPFLVKLGEYGASGVNVFFAISGVLICGRLLQEEKNHGSISWRNFYTRRAFRILPPALLYLLTIAVLSPLLGVTRLEWFSSLFFFRNYVYLASHPPAHWFTGHFWSLAVEEHFYLILPVILVLFPKRRVWVLGALTCAIAAWRIWLVRHTTGDLGFRSDTVLDGLFLAAMVAIAANSNRYGAYLRRFTTPLVSVALVGVYVTLLFINVPFNLVLRGTVLPLLLLSTSLHPEGIAGRILELAPLRWVGRLSYSLYLWQQLFFCGRWWQGVLPLGVLQQWPLNLVGLFVCAVISYYLLERPMIRLGHRIASSGVPGRAVDQDNATETPVAQLVP
jgi:peptidoglycan/LPS O-acetylase OafA/YrhL